MMLSADKSWPTIAFVLPWYSQNIVGGAEIETKKLAQNLQARGLSVEILTTCAKDGASGWSKDHHREGKTVEDGLAIRRFKLDCRPLTRFVELNQRLIKGQRLNPEEEILFMTEFVNSDRLYAYIAKNRSDYVFVFIPYLVGTTYWGSRVAPERSYIIPCLHDEGYARMRLLREMFGGMNRVLCHTIPEKDLARKLYGLDDRRLFLLGEGIDADVKGHADSFRAKFGLREPFVLYVGRRGEGKNTPLLIDHFCRFKTRNPGDLKLVLVGEGPLSLPPSLTNEVIDLGYLSEQAKHDAYAAALVTCQPSVNESFSIVIMESWIQETPVLVNALCEVTRDHCIRSNGGLYFTDYWEFEECLRYYMGNQPVRQKMGKLGSQYVQANSSWERITRRFVSAIFED